MTKLQFQPFDKKELKAKLKEAFPNYKVQGSRIIQVRTSGFTVTGNVQIITKPKKGKITTKTNLEMAIVYLIFFLPLGIYIFSRAKKQKAMEREVVEKLKEILGPEIV